MEGDHARAPADGIEQRGNVGEADDRFRPAGDGLIVDAVEQPNGAIAAPDAPDCIDRRVCKGLVEISEPLVVGTGEIAMAAIGVFA
jgi:hypothetical protein